MGKGDAIQQSMRIPARLSELEALGERIAALSAQIQAATYQLLVMLREFDERAGWNSGFRSCAHWLNWRTGLDLGAAREKVRVARALASLPQISAAMERGAVSFSKVRALTRVATAGNEGELLELALAGTAAHVEKVVRGWRRVDRLAEAEHEAKRHAGRYLNVYRDEDAMVRVEGRLTPEAGEALLKALAAGGDALFDQAREERDEAGDGVTAEQRRADALGLVAESALATGLDPGTRGDRYQVVLHVDAPRLRGEGGDAETDGQSLWQDGAHVSAETSRRLACDCAVVEMRHDADGRVLDVGRRARKISPALRRALKRRDEGCRFPGCGLRLCDAHHVEHWADGGATKLDNLVLLCRRHHRAVHEEGFRVELSANGQPRFFRPDGRVLHDAPLLRAAAGDASIHLQRDLERMGIWMDPTAGLPSWDGTPVDVALAVNTFASLGKAHSRGLYGEHDAGARLSCNTSPPVEIA
jgi:hypothetical protein